MSRAPVPATPNVPPRVGIVQASNPAPATTERWEDGFAFEPEACEGGGVFDPCAVGIDLTPPAGPGVIEVEPFGVWAGDRCSTFGRTERDWAGRARRLLEAAQSKHLGRELWRGDLARDAGWPNKYLAQHTAQVLNGSPQTPEDALALLEQGLADCLAGGIGMIHATRQLVTLWSYRGALRFDGGQILTINGTRVVSEAGYDGSGPAADAGSAPAAAGPGSVWAYGTGLVTVRLGAIETQPGSLEDARAWAQATDRRTNDVQVVATRQVAYDYPPCCHVAVEVDIDPPASGGS